MRVPLNWLKDYVKLPKDRGELTDKLTMAGHMLDKVDQVHGNTIIDLELRGNRADCYSIFGIAKEVSALFKTPVTYPKLTTKLKKVNNLKEVSLDIKTPYVKRVMMTVVNDVKILPSPKWLKENLEEYGVESINNIVDLTNFVMLETGEPMHAFDLEKIGKNLQIRLAKEGETMLTFLGKTVTLTKEDLVWSNNKTSLSIAGAIGEKTHSISNSTKNILLEAASYDRANIRRSIHRHSLFTEAGIRHEKELDPNLVEVAVTRFCDLIEKNKWGKVSSIVSDYYPNPVKPWKATLSYDFLRSLSGIEISKTEVIETFKWLGFEIAKETDTYLEVLVPTHRTDVVLEEDLIEELLRIYGYDKLPNQTLSLEIPEIITSSYIKQELKLKTDLVSLGFDEIISVPFVKENLLSLNADLKESNLEKVKIVNRPSPDTEVLRMSLLPNLYSAAQKVKNERGTFVQFFEVGKTYAKKSKEYIEKRKLGIIYWSKEENDFYTFKGILDSVLIKIGLDKFEFDNETQLKNLSNPYKLIVGGKIVGHGGKFKENHYLEVDLDLILEEVALPKARLWPKYPPQIEDLTLILPEQTRVGAILNEIKNTKDVEDVELMDIYETAYTFRVWYQSPTKTLAGKEVEKIREKILSTLNKKFAVVIKD